MRSQARLERRHLDRRMFRLELHQLLYAYTGLCLSVILLASWWHNLRRSHREHLALRNLVKCALCAFEFRDPGNPELPRCPRCGALVNRDRISRL